MDCATVCCDPDEVCTTLHCKHTWARKDEKCTECRQPIIKGDLYLKEVTVFEGKVETWKTCSSCESIRDNFFTDGWMWTAIIDMLEDHIRYCGGDISESVISKLNHGAKAVVCGMIQDVWQDQEDDE